MGATYTTKGNEPEDTAGVITGDELTEEQLAAVSGGRHHHHRHGHGHGHGHHHHHRHHHHHDWYW